MLMKRDGLGRPLAVGGFILLLCGSLGPWQYGKLNTAYAWQPIWVVFGSLLGGFVVLAFAAVSGYSFIEVRYRGGKSVVVSGALWAIALVGLLFVAPIISIIVWGTPNATALLAEGSIGWGLIVATIGAVVHLIGLRLQLHGLLSA